MSDFATTMGVLAGLSDEQMGRSWHWRGEAEDLGVRDGYHRVLEAEMAQLARVDARRRVSEPEAAMSQAQRALGGVLGLLAGQADSVLDVVPAPGDWPLRDVVGHMLEVELSFCANVRWSITRSADQPLMIPQELRPTDADAPREGSVAALMERLARAREATDEVVSHLAAEDLDKPSGWAGHHVDVRFRLHRFASHLTEHGIHAEKVLRATGHEPAEARRLVQAIWATRGAHERRSNPEELARLEAAHAAMWAEMRAAATGT